MRVRWCPRRRGVRCRRVILLHRDRVRTCRSAAARSVPGQERRLIQKSGDIVGGGFTHTPPRKSQCLFSGLNALCATYLIAHYLLLKACFVVRGAWAVLRDCVDGADTVARAHSLIVRNEQRVNVNEIAAEALQRVFQLLVLRLGQIARLRWISRVVGKRIGRTSRSRRVHCHRL